MNTNSFEKIINESWNNKNQVNSKSRRKILNAIIKTIDLLDSGKIIMQKKLKVYKSDDSLSLKKRILKEEHKLYPVAISRFLSNL